MYVFLRTTAGSVASRRKVSLLFFGKVLQVSGLSEVLEDGC